MHFNFNTFGLGLSGGNRFIFELSNSLIEHGYKVTINNVGCSDFSWFSPVKAHVQNSDLKLNLLQRFLNKTHLKPTDFIEKKQNLLLRNMPDCDINVATFWATAKPTSTKNIASSYYLVQHFEPCFYPKNKRYYKQALNSYSYPLKKLCVSHWLSDKLKGTNIGNGINLTKFNRHSDISKIPNSVMFSFRNAKWKNSDLATKIAYLLKIKGFTVFSSKEDLTEEELIKLYNQSELYVNLSYKEGFGYGMLEAMACHCAVASTPCAEYLRNKGNCVFIPFSTTPEQITSLIINLFKQKSLLDILVKNGLFTAQKYNFKFVVEKFLKSINEVN